jgi:hypothetical protein
MLSKLKNRLVALVIIVLITVAGIAQGNASIIRNPPVVAPVVPGGTGSAIVGDFKWSYLTADNNGWYRTDGRLISNLPTAQQNAAALVGIFGNLPTTAGRGVVDGNTLPNGTIGGTNAITLSQANLPNISLTSTSVSGGTPSGSVAINTGGTHNHSMRMQFRLSGGTTGAGGAILLSGAGASITTGASEVQTQSDGSHNHTGGFTGTALPTHSHTVSLGGSGTAIDTRDPYIYMRGFIYLGT